MTDIFPVTHPFPLRYILYAYNIVFMQDIKISFGQSWHDKLRTNNLIWLCCKIRNRGHTARVHQKAQGCYCRTPNVGFAPTLTIVVNIASLVTQLQTTQKNHFAIKKCCNQHFCTVNGSCCHTTTVSAIHKQILSWQHSHCPLARITVAPTNI